MIFTKKIKELFEKRGERASFSKMTNISHQKLSQWQKGSIAGVDKIETFCKLSGLSANWLILDVGPKELSKSNNEKENKSEFKETNLEYHERLERILNNPKYKEAIIHNLEAFGNADEGEKKMDDKMKELVETMEERFSAKMEKKMEEILKRKDGEKEETTQKRDAAQNE